MNIYCTLDTETVGGAMHPEGIYHLAGIIHDRKGNVYGCFNYLIAEYLDRISADDYAKKNIALYDEMLFEGTATVIPTQDMAISVVNALLEYYSVNTMCAFNSGFDYGKTACKAFLEGREFIDLFLMAAQTIAPKRSYGKFCREYGLFSKSKKSIGMSAENFYAYLTNDPQYCEEHTALEDSKIELEIFNACIASHKAFTKNTHFSDFEKRFSLIQKI